jgi:glutaredoxin-like YruB-family protein
MFTSSSRDIMPQKKVLVYSTPTCPHCVALKEYLKEHNVKYTDIDVSQDREALDEMVEKSGQMGVPVIIIDDKTVIVGFDRAALEMELDIQD